MNKFENVDVIASLQAVMKQNTTHYQSDFQYDADLFRAAAKSADSMEKTFLWLSRPDGTYCNGSATPCCGTPRNIWNGVPTAGRPKRSLPLP